MIARPTVCRFVIPFLLTLHSIPLPAKDPDRPPRPIDVEPDDLKPGLHAQYRSLQDKEVTLSRIDPKPAFYLGQSSPHPRLPPGPFEVTWTGVLNLTEHNTTIAFEAFVCGEVTIELQGVSMLQGRGESQATKIGPGKSLKLESGTYRLKIVYRSLPRLPARLQVWWQGSTFSSEPIPAWVLKHQPTELPAAFSRERLAHEGRMTAEQMGCARCHQGSLPGITAPPPGPSLADVGRRVTVDWLAEWLAGPAKVKPESRMPALFPENRDGFVERWIVADYLVGASEVKRVEREPSGDHRMGRRHFVSVGCAACHFLPDVEHSQQESFDRTELKQLKERFPGEELSAFLGNPHTRYPDGRMPRLPLSPDMSRDLASYLLLWSEARPVKPLKPPSANEIQSVSKRLRARGIQDTAIALVREKRCAECHPGLGQSIPAQVPITALDGKKGCLSGKTGPRFSLKDKQRESLSAYLAVAPSERHPSPFAARQELIQHLGCVRCHQREGDRPPPLEVIGSKLGGAWLQFIPFQRTPRLTYPHQKYSRSHLVATVREGIAGLRPSRYTYRMPGFGHNAEAVVQALAEGDGDLPEAPEETPRPPTDPTLGPLAGPVLAGFQGYACVSCHLWDGKQLAATDPGTMGTELTRLNGRIRRDWFDRYLENPARSHPGTPMPSIFEKGQPAKLRSVLDGDPLKQRDALWNYFQLGKKAPSPKPPPPLAVVAPPAG